MVGQRRFKYKNFIIEKQYHRDESVYIIIFNTPNNGNYLLLPTTRGYETMSSFQTKDQALKYAMKWSKK